MSEQIYTGLSQQEVEERIQKGLVNKVTVSTEKTTWQIIQSNVFTYFNFIFFKSPSSSWLFLLRKFILFSSSSF